MAAEEDAASRKPEIVSKTIIKPSSPTPSHLRHFNLSLLDHLSPPSFFVPIILFYNDVVSSDLTFLRISQTLKSSLSQILSLYYPFCGTLVSQNGVVFVDCENDNNQNGVVFLDAKIPCRLSDFLLRERDGPDLPNRVKQFLPFDPYDPNDDVRSLMMSVQFSEFECGSVVLGACVSHKVCDGATIGSFLKAWSEKARGVGARDDHAPNMEGGVRFPARGMTMNPTRGMIGEKDIVTRRLVLSGKSLRELRERISDNNNDNDNFKVTKVEAVTALIWKSAIEAAVAATDKSARNSYTSMVLHAVNLRRRMEPPLPDNAMGNLWRVAASPLVEVDTSMDIDVQELAQIVRKTIRKIDGEYVRKLEEGEEGVYEVLKSLKEVMFLVAEKGIPCYSFSSWTRFGFYDTNFGWGNPMWVCTIGVPIRNVVVLMPTSDGDGIEAWVTLNKLHMAHFLRNPHLFHFASFDP